MNRKPKSFVRPTRDGQRGQVLILAAASIVAVLGFAAFVVDIAFIVYAQRSLQATTDAAALAGAQDINVAGGTPITKATSFSAVTGNKNARPNLPNIAMVSGFPQLKCLTSTGVTCTTNQTPATSSNAIVVKQQATVPLFFAKILGISQVLLSATSTASARGGVPKPLDVMVVLDATGSMRITKCNAAVAGITPTASRPNLLDCAEAGIRALLSTLWPCSQDLVNCGTVTAGNVANPIDKVGLMIFPGIKAAAVSKEYDCTTNILGSDVLAYNASPTYQIIPLSSDYRVSVTAALNGAASNLVKAVDWADGAGCGGSPPTYGIEAPSVIGTYYAAAITAAQASLVANGRPDALNVIILLSDGDANAPSGPANQCQGAIVAAWAAANATPANQGSRVYSIAYGAVNSYWELPPNASTHTCSTDPAFSLTPADTMQQIASSPGKTPDPTKWFDTPAASDLTAVFQKIAFDLTSSRLIPDNTP